MALSLNSQEQGWAAGVGGHLDFFDLPAHKGGALLAALLAALPPLLALHASGGDARAQGQGGEPGGKAPRRPVPQTGGPGEAVHQAVGCRCLCCPEGATGAAHCEVSVPLLQALYCALTCPPPPATPPRLPSNLPTSWRCLQRARGTTGTRPSSPPSRRPLPLPRDPPLCTRRPSWPAGLP